MASTRKMLTEEWIRVADNPIQRDTEKHAAKAKHLMTPHPTHSVVHAAELPSGKLVKLDGHTRALMWKRKDIPAPTQVTVVVYMAKDMAEVEQLYKDFDSKDALETNRDKAFGAFRRHNFQPQSDLLASGALTYALRLAYGVNIGLRVTSAMSPSPSNSSGKTKSEDTATMRVKAADIYTMVDEFSYELNALDAFGLGRGSIPAGIVAAFIVSYRRYGRKVTPFWTGVFGGHGSKISGQMDAIQALIELMLSRRGHYGGKSAADMFARALMAVEKYLKDEMLFSIPRPLDTTEYLVGHERPTERLIKKADIGKKVA